MKRVLVIANNLEQASYRLRIAALVPLMKQRGIEWDVQLRPQSVISRRRVLGFAGEYDAVILQRKLLDPTDARLLRRSAKKIVYDIDDAVMVHEHPRGVISRWRTRRRFDATAEIVDHVVAGNEHLAEMFRNRGKPATVIPTGVDPARYSVKQHAPTESPALVWIGSHSTVPYVEQFLPALEAARVRLIVIADKAPTSDRLPIEFMPWSAETETSSLSRGDIGIAPTPDTPWTRGKSGFKIVQYMAAGLPTIASPVGANSDIVVDGVTGKLPSDHTSWTNAIIELAGNPSMRAAMGRAARKRAETQYALSTLADEWAKLL